MSSRRQIQRIGVVVALVFILLFWTPFFITLHFLDAPETVVIEIAEDARAPPHDIMTTRSTRKNSLRTSRPNSSTTTTSTTMTATTVSNNNNLSDVKSSEQQEHETSSWKQRILYWTAAVAETASWSSIVEWWYMFLLAVQFAAQPILVGWFIPESICRSTYVLTQEMVKFIMAACLLYMSGSWTRSAAGWSVVTWWIVAGIPAGLFVIQSYCNLMAYQNLAPINFNVLNQTKTLMAALCIYLVMGKVQSKFQILALLLLLMSALVIEKVIPLRLCVGMRNNHNNNDAASANQDDDEKAKEERKSHIFKGVLPILLASFISGLAGALTQKNLQFGKRNPYLYSMELSAASTLILLTSLFVPILGKSPDRKLIDQQGLRYGWTYQTWIPVLTNAGGGIVVGLVTKHAGAVRKGFASIFGLLLSGILQARLSKNQQNRRITPEQVVGGLLAAISLWMHAKFPHQNDDDTMQ